MDKEQGIIRQVLRHELTWAVFTIGALWGFVSTVVLPIQALQISIAQIQEQLSTDNSAYDIFEIRLDKLEAEHIIVKDRLKL